MIEVGDGFGQRAHRCGLLQGPLRPMRVVEVPVLTRHGYQVAVVADQRPVEQFSPAVADPPVRCLSVSRLA
jgi:hypothetical protein